MYYNLASAFHFSPGVVDKMKVYMVVVYYRRLEKSGFFGEKKKEDVGTIQDFTKIFGTEMRPE